VRKDLGILRTDLNARVRTVKGPERKKMFVIQEKERSKQPGSTGPPR